MARFHFNPDNNLIVVNNIPHRGECFSAEESGGWLIVNILGENNGGASCEIPLFAVIGVKGNSVSVYGNIKLINWGNGDYDVEYSLEKYYYYTPPAAIAQKSYLFNGETFTATLFKDNSLHFLLECDDKTVNFDVPVGLTAPQLLFQPTSLGFLVILTAENCGGEYLFLAIYDGEFRRLYEDTAESIVFSERAFTVTEKLKDMLGRRRVTEYSFNNTKLSVKSRRFDYEHDKDYPEELTPYLFLEALQAGDEKRMERYLDDELLSAKDSFKDYFGEFEKIECPKYRAYNKKSGLSEVALLYPLKNAVNTPKIFRFVLSDGKISNIEA